MWIKICANTNVEDARLAAELGADAVGFVFAPSVRRVTADEVAPITSQLPASLEKVGVFQSNLANDIAAIVDEAGLSAVQLHGDFELALPKKLHQLFQERIKIIQVLHWQVGSPASAAQVSQQLRQIEAEGIVDRVLIDSKVGAASGGTGVAFNWVEASAVLARAAGALKLIVAGGLRQDNVAQAIRGLNPWGVDVASGVEAAPGQKDPEKLAAFIKNARAASR